MIAYCTNPKHWKFGVQRTYDDADVRWTWFFLGPIAINLGKW